MRPKLAEVYDQLYERGYSRKPLKDWETVPVIRHGQVVWIVQGDMTDTDRFEHAEQCLRLARRDAPGDPQTAALEREMRRINMRRRNE